MTRVRSLVFGLCLAMWVTPLAAQAQPSSGTVFVAGTGFAGIRWAPTTDDRGTSASGAAPGGGLGLGVHLTPRLSARAEWAFTGRLEDTTEPQVFPTEPFAPFIGTLDVRVIPAVGLRAPLSFTERRETKAGLALLGYHFQAGRASIELLAGLGLVHERVTRTTEVSIQIFPPQPGFRTEVVSGHHSAVPVIGVDAAVSLTGHASLVPQVRAYVLNGALNVWPGVGLRWTF